MDCKKVHVEWLQNDEITNLAERNLFVAFDIKTMRAIFLMDPIFFCVLLIMSDSRGGEDAKVFGLFIGLTFVSGVREAEKMRRRVFAGDLEGPPVLPFL